MLEDLKLKEIDKSLFKITISNQLTHDILFVNREKFNKIDTYEFIDNNNICLFYWYSEKENIYKSDLFMETEHIPIYGFGKSEIDAVQDLLNNCFEHYKIV
jgi:hypothetical protein